MKETGPADGVRPVTRSPFARALFAGFSLLSLLIFAIPAAAQFSTVVVPKNLAELTRQSETIVQGRIVRVSLEPHETLRNLTTVHVTVQVEETLKGQAGTTFSFQQAILDKRQVEGMLGYHAGQHVLLLLNPASKYGLSSTAGQDQGRFLITAGRNGRLQAANRLGNAGLFRGMPAPAESSTLPNDKASQTQKADGQSVSLQSLKKVIREMVATP